jgi:hypothetical protein
LESARKDSLSFYTYKKQDVGPTCINMLQATLQHLIKEGTQLYPSWSDYIRNNLLLTPTLKIVSVVTIPRLIKTQRLYFCLSGRVSVHSVTSIMIQAKIQYHIEALIYSK